MINIQWIKYELIDEDVELGEESWEMIGTDEEGNSYKGIADFKMGEYEQVWDIQKI